MQKFTLLLQQTPKIFFLDKKGIVPLFRNIFRKDQNEDRARMLRF